MLNLSQFISVERSSLTGDLVETVLGKHTFFTWRLNCIPISYVITSVCTLPSNDVSTSFTGTRGTWWRLPYAISNAFRNRSQHQHSAVRWDWLQLKADTCRVAVQVSTGGRGHCRSLFATCSILSLNFHFSTSTCPYGYTEPLLTIFEPCPLYWGSLNTEN
jgi:hypothetical protein